MLPDPSRPVASFLKGCLGLAVIATLGLMVWTLTLESGQVYCVPDAPKLYGVCRPTLKFLATGGLWFVLIYVALALPALGMALLRRLHGPGRETPPRRDDDAADDRD